MCTRAIVLFVFLASAASVSAAEWKKQRSGSLAWLHSVQFVDADHGFAAGSNGTLLVTNNAGGEWRKLLLSITDTIRDVHFLDRSNGWMLCDRGKFRSGRNPSYLMRTADGGRTWSPVEFKDSPERFSRMFLSAGGSGYLIGEGGMVAGLPIGEAAETRGVLPVRYLMTDGAAAGDSRIILVGGGGSVIASDDSGRSWHSARFADEIPSRKLNAIFLLDARNGWLSGNGGSIFSTTDGGRSWRSQNSGTEADLADIAFYDGRTGFAVGDRGVVLRTEDAGSKWTPDASGVKHRLERIAFAGRKAVAVGFGGTIIATDMP